MAVGYTAQMMMHDDIQNTGAQMSRVRKKLHDERMEFKQKWIICLNDSLSSLVVLRSNVEM